MVKIIIKQGFILTALAIALGINPIAAMEHRNLSRREKILIAADRRLAQQLQQQERRRIARRNRQHKQSQKNNHQTTQQQQIVNDEVMARQLQQQYSRDNNQNKKYKKRKNTTRCIKNPNTTTTQTNTNTTISTNNILAPFHVDVSNNIAKQHGDNLCGYHALKNADALVGWLQNCINLQQRNKQFTQKPTASHGNLEAGTIYRLSTNGYGRYLAYNHVTVIPNMSELADNNFSVDSLHKEQLNSITNCIDAIKNTRPSAHAFILANATHRTNNHGQLQGGYDHWIAVVVHVQHNGSVVYYYADSAGRPSTKRKINTINNLAVLLSKDSTWLRFCDEFEHQLNSLKTVLQQNGTSNIGLLNNVVTTITDYQYGITQQSSLTQLFVQNYLPELVNIFVQAVRYEKVMHNNEKAQQFIKALEPILPFMLKHTPINIAGGFKFTQSDLQALQYDSQQHFYTLTNTPYCNNTTAKQTTNAPQVMQQCITCGNHIQGGAYLGFNNCQHIACLSCAALLTKGCPQQQCGK